ncbi:MAG TPA: hypothetical protein VMU18_05540, partial [Rhodoblastus sp.]|nr:hypothetical protein [Rhodoblastus sp.]
NATFQPGATGALPFQFPSYESVVQPFERALAGYRRASECLMQGYMEVFAKQTEFVQRIMLEGMSELQDLTRVRGADDLMKTEFGFARGNTERSLDVLRTFNDDIRHCYFNAIDLAVSEINSAVAKDPAAKKKTRSAV